MMQSKIRYVSENEIKLKREVISLIKEHFTKYDVRCMIFSPTYYYDLLLYAKFVIEKEKMDYVKIIDGEVDELVKILKEKFSKYFIPSFVNNFVKCKLYEILKKMAFEDYEIVTYKDRVLDAYLDSDKKYLLIGNRHRYRDLYYAYPNVDIYDVDMEKRKQLIWEILDEITGNQREYYTNLKDINLDKYDSIIYLNGNIDFKEYVCRKHHIVGKKIFMICSYSFVSKYKGNFEEIESVLIDNSMAYIKYYGRNRNYRLGEEEDKVNIKELSNVADSDLKKIINTDKEIKDISIYVSAKEFVDHARRLGFTTYNNDNERRDKILRLVDYNYAIIKRINELDDEISKQIDRLFVR